MVSKASILLTQAALHPSFLILSEIVIAINMAVNVRLYVWWGPPSDQIALLNISK